MASECTPKSNEIRRVYLGAFLPGRDMNSANVEFDRFLAERDRAAKEAAWDECAAGSRGGRGPGGLVNPYRIGGQ